MKYLIMTEGTCEEAFINVLIDKNIFKIPTQELLYEEIFHARQIKDSLIEKINRLPQSSLYTRFNNNIKIKGITCEISLSNAFFI